mmetsp:Transcript_5929/g.13801  ORF Transcript_5929/g.13801 Transcript_5929/m.13801 type:complete len:236 (-) Transcript_5929:380-1087(-)
MFSLPLRIARWMAMFPCSLTRLRPDTSLIHKNLNTSSLPYIAALWRRVIISSSVAITEFLQGCCFKASASPCSAASSRAGVGNSETMFKASAQMNSAMPRSSLFFTFIVRRSSRRSCSETKCSLSCSSRSLILWVALSSASCRLPIWDLKSDSIRECSSSKAEIRFCCSTSLLDHSSSFARCCASFVRSNASSSATFAVIVIVGVSSQVQGEIARASMQRSCFALAVALGAVSSH